MTGEFGKESDIVKPYSIFIKKEIERSHWRIGNIRLEFRKEGGEKTRK